MKKKSVWLVLTVVALVMAISLTACFKKDNEEVEQNNIQLSETVIFEENANSFSLKAETAQTEVIEKEITITPYQSGVIKIKKSVSSGELYVDIMNRKGYDLLNSSILDEEEVIDIPEGAGTYQVRFDMEDFIGSCEVTWEVKDIYSEKDFASALGYELKYIPEKFSYKNENGRETFTLKSQNQSDTELYFSVYMVDAVNKETERTKLKERSTVSSDCKFDEGTLLGEYAIFPQDNNTEIMNFMFDLNDGRLLVIETLQYKDLSGGSSANAYIEGLISSFSYEQ